MSVITAEHLMVRTIVWSSESTPGITQASQHQFTIQLIKGKGKLAYQVLMLDPAQDCSHMLSCIFLQINS